MHRIALTVAVAASALAGCSPAPTPPVIDSVQLPDTVTADASGEYPVPIVLTIHDDDDTIDELRTQVPAIGMTFSDGLLLAPGIQHQVNVMLRFPSNTAKQAYELDFSLVDATGLTSLVVKEMVTLQ